MIDLPPITWQMVLHGLAVFAGGVLAGWVLRILVAKVLGTQGRSDSSVRVFSQLTQVIVTVLVGAASMTIVFPSVKPVDVLGGITIISLAAGIAFQTVLGNMFAGMVILARDRFRVGDQIQVGEFPGTVSQMGLSHTSLRTFDGRLVVIPNQTLHSEIVTVQTGYERVRSAVVVDLDDSEDLTRARNVLLEAMHRVPEVLRDPAPEALLVEIGTKTVRMELRFWSGARQLETRTAQDAVIRSVVEAMSTLEVKSGDDVVTVHLVGEGGRPTPNP